MACVSIIDMNLINGSRFVSKSRSRLFKDSKYMNMMYLSSHVFDPSTNYYVATKTRPETI